MLCTKKKPKPTTEFYAFVITMWCSDSVVEASHYFVAAAAAVGALRNYNLNVL